MISSLASYIPTLEKYLLADDRNAYIESLKPQSKERILLDLLTLKLDKNFNVEVMSALEQKLQEIGISADEFLSYKSAIFLKHATKKEDIQMIFQLMKDKFGEGMEFNHPKPIDIVDVNHEETSENKTQNEANFPENYDEIIEQKMKIINQNKNIDILTDFGMKKMGEQRLLKLDYKIKQDILTRRRSFYRIFPDVFIIKFIDKFATQKRAKENSHYSLPDIIYASLTKSQLELLLKSQPDISKDFNYMQYWYKQNYVERLDRFAKNALLSISEKEEKRKLLVEILEGVKNFKTLITKALEEQTFMELLVLDLSLENPHKKLFIQYLQNMYVPCNILSTKYNTKVQMRNEQHQIQQKKEATSKIAYNQNIGNDNVWHNIHRYEMVTWTPDKLIVEYLVSLFKMEDKPDDLANTLVSYFNEDFLKKICTKVKLTKGETVPNVNYILKPDEITELKDKKKVSILSKNKKIFKVDEDVVLTIRVKNVKSIKVKIYELNLEKSYLEKQNKIDENMNLSFLEPTKSFDYEVENTNPFKEAIYELPIKEIEKKQAVYIVDLQSQGISSRAVIRKGGIVCLKRTTVAGLQLKFYNEEGKRIEELDLWINSKKEHIKNTHTIPFSKAAQNLNIIAVKDSYAELIDVAIPAESYSWNIGYIYGYESFIVGNKAKIAIHPRLKLQDECIGLKILTKSKITVQIINYQDIKSYYTFDKIQWCNKSDYIIEFPIQSYTKTINVTVSAEIPLYCGEKFKLEDRKTINIDLNETEMNFISSYLNRGEDGYYLQLLGVNGEPIPNTDVTVIAHFIGIKETTSKLLRSNAEGRVKLGKLSLVSTIDIQIEVQQVGYASQHSRSWVINDHSQEVNYVGSQYYKQNQLISLPLSEGVTIDDIVILKKGIQGLINANVTKFAHVKHGRLEIQGLTPGVYEIQFLLQEAKINIEVLSGKQWEANNQVYCPQKQAVYEIARSNNHMIGLGEAKTEDKGQKVHVQIQLNALEKGINESVHAHVMVQNYKSPSISGQFQTNTFINAPKTISQKFVLKENQYYNNKTLSEEGSYVENRQNEKKFIGNNLEKPRIFLKRLEVRDTCQQEEILEKQGKFYPSMNAGGARRANVDITSADANPRLPVPVSNIDSHNNFLASPGLLLANIKGDVLQFQIPKGYNNFRVYLLSSDGALQKSYSLNHNIKNKLKDLRHVGIKDVSQDKGWTMSREVYHLTEGETMKINRDSIWSTVSLSNIAAFAEIKSAKIKEWVTSWNNYPQQKKQEVYEKEFCHEINVFIRENDPQFFKNVVRPYISNKIIKTFVDYALLDDEKCQEYTTIEKLQKLNDFEKVLLVKYLVGCGKVERAKQIAKSMELKQKLNKIPFDEFKRQFDTVINSQKIDEFNPNNMNVAGGGGGSYPGSVAQPMMAQPMVYGGTGVAYGYGNSAQYMVQQQQMSYDPFSNVGYVQQSSAPQMQMQVQNARLNNWALDARNMSYNAVEAVPMQQMSHAVPQVQASYNAINDRSNRSYNAANVMNVKNKSYAGNMRQQQQSKNLFQENEQLSDQQEEQQLKLRQKFKQGFKAVQKTKEYTQTTYKGVKTVQQSQYLVSSSSFWSTLASHLIEKSKSKFLTDAFMHLNSQVEFTLAMCFLGSGVNADFDLKNEGESIVITAKNAFSIFIKQVRPIAYVKKFGVMINQRFIDPFNRYTYEQDGTSIEKEVNEFIVRKVYSYQTVVTNTSGTTLQLQLLLDVPEGSVPIQSHEYTQIKSVVVMPYSTSSFERCFYFPAPGNYTMYPANACRGKEVISKGPSLGTIEVKPLSTAVKMESFNDIIRLGNEADVIEFLNSKNIFDPNIFNASSILWMLKNKTVFEKIIAVLRSRCYFSEEIWQYSIYHKDLQGIKEILSVGLGQSKEFDIPIFEYFPYFSSRTHKFLNESKSTIRNVEFKNTYYKFLITLALNGTQTSVQKITFLYYLLLQDRIEQASNLYNKLTQAQKNAHRLQADYFQCFLDMYQGYPSFVKARKISSLYINYPIATWKNLFKEVYDLLKNYDTVTYVEEETKAQYKTTIIKQKTEIRVSIPPNTKIEVHYFCVNLQLYFSEFPFSSFKDFSTVKPMETISFPAGKSREEKILRPENAKDIFVEIYESRQGKPAEKLDSFHWSHPELKIKMSQSKGNAQVFFRGKQYPGCYCKVYSSGTGGQKFYRDGYTDITGTFKYVLADFENITKFKILFITEHGGVIIEAKPPSTAGTLSS